MVSETLGSSKQMTVLSRSADLNPPKMRRDGRMAGLVKLRRSARPRSERQVRVVRVGRHHGRIAEASLRLAPTAVLRKGTASA